MTDLSVRRLRLVFLTLASVAGICAQRLKEDVVKSGRCTTAFNPLKNVCYLYVPTLTDQPTALQACERKGGILAALDTAKTAAFVEDGVSANFTGHYCAWIGYNKDYDEWYDGSAFSWTKWYSGEPNRDHEKCVMVVKSNYRWKDLGCARDCFSVCQLPEREMQAYAKKAEKMQGSNWSTPRSERRAVSKIRCGQYCLQDPLCGKFNFHPTTLNCALYDEEALVDEADGSQTFTF